MPGRFATSQKNSALSESPKKCRKTWPRIGPRGGSRRGIRVSATAPIVHVYLHILWKVSRDVCMGTLRLLAIESMHRYEGLQTDGSAKGGGGLPCQPGSRTRHRRFTLVRVPSRIPKLC